MILNKVIIELGFFNNIYDIIINGGFMLLSNEWLDYECLSAGNGEKLERWGNVILRRPDPQAMWPIKNSNLWNNIDAHYHRNNYYYNSYNYTVYNPVTRYTK